MKILITNDDGIEAAGIAKLTEWARTLGEVTVVAPKTEQSAKSHGIDLRHPFEVKKSTLFGDIRAFSVASTPADCVRFAMIGLGEKFDLVLSGINRGFNLGTDIVYSGTVGAAFEAVSLGARAIAVSTAPDTLTEALEHLEKAYAFITENGLFSYASLYNVNIPSGAKGIVIARQGEIYYSDHFVACGEDLYRQEGYLAYTPSNDLTLDTDAVMAGYITVTPLTLDRTDFAAYERITGLKK